MEATCRWRLGLPKAAHLRWELTSRGGLMFVLELTVILFSFFLLVVGWVRGLDQRD